MNTALAHELDSIGLQKGLMAAQQSGVYLSTRVIQKAGFRV